MELSSPVVVARPECSGRKRRANQTQSRLRYVVLKVRCDGAARRIVTDMIVMEMGVSRPWRRLRGILPSIVKHALRGIAYSRPLSINGNRVVTLSTAQNRER